MQRSIGHLEYNKNDTVTCTYIHVQQQFSFS